MEHVFGEGKGKFFFPFIIKFFFSPFRGSSTVLLTRLLKQFTSFFFAYLNARFSVFLFAIFHLDCQLQDSVFKYHEQVFVLNRIFLLSSSLVV